MIRVIDVNPSRLKPLYDAYRKLSNFEYGYPDGIDNENFWDGYYNLTVNEFLQKKKGVCWDYTRAMEHLLLFKYPRKDVHCFFIVSGGMNHTFNIVRIGDSYYYPECAWQPYKGIYKSDDIDSLLNLVRLRFGETLPNERAKKKIGLLEYEDKNMLSGMSGRVFYDYVVHHGVWTEFEDSFAGIDDVTLIMEDSGEALEYNEDKAREKIMQDLEDFDYRNNTTTESFYRSMDYLFQGSPKDQMYYFESKLRAEDRKKIPDELFGVPSLRKFPLHDKSHVLSAIRMFNHVDKKHEAELARNVMKAMEKYHIPKEAVGQKNHLYDYL